MGSHRAHPRSSTPITAAHWRRLLRPARSRRSARRRALAAQGPGAVALGDVRHLARRDHGRARVEGARVRQDLGPRPAATTRKSSSWPSRLDQKKCAPMPNWRRSGRELPKGDVEIEPVRQPVVARMPRVPAIGQNGDVESPARQADGPDAGIGTRPMGAPSTSGTEWAYIFARRSVPRIGERRRAGHALACDTDAMAASSCTSSTPQCRIVAIPPTHAVLIVDQAELAT